MFFLDAHSHFYECFSLETFLSSIYRNIEKLPEQSSLDGAGIILTERNDCNFYRRLIEDTKLHKKLSSLGYIQNANTIEKRDHALPCHALPLNFYPGRQVSSSEKIEVLALFYKNLLPENIPLNELINHIRESGAIPVINWAPGKWLGKRGDLIRKFLNENSNGNSAGITLGITSLLPKYFPYPSIIRESSARNIPLVAGSDPLPFKNQELLPASYGMLFDSLPDKASDEEIKTEILNKKYRITGQRSSLPASILRVFSNEIIRRKNVL